MIFHNGRLSLLEAEYNDKMIKPAYDFNLLDTKLKNYINSFDIQGKKIGITIGSRGISRISSIVKLLVTFLRTRGAQPIIIPAMGSHGGNSKAGKIRVLSSLGLTEKSINAPIYAGTETQMRVTTVSGKPVYCLEEALLVDFIVIVNRIKSHTDFQDDIGSGIIKMAAVGLGGEKGAKIVHADGYNKLGDNIKEIGLKQLEQLPILFAVAIIENFDNTISSIELVKPLDILQQEQALYNKAKELQDRLPVNELDILIIKNFGKNISGAGMDPFITGRYPSGQVSKPFIKRIVVLRLTSESHGNAVGIGLADLITASFFKDIDQKTFYNNVLACNGFLSGKIPVIMPDDQAAIDTAISSITKEINNLTLILIENTSDLKKIYITSSLKDEVLKKGYDIKDYVNFKFNCKGNLSI